MDIRLRGRRALVTASSKGLGLACARALIEEGAEVCINGRDPDTLERAAAALRQLSAGVRAVVADITTAAGRQRLLEEAGELDILVTNIGGMAVKPGAAMSDEDWMRSVEALMLPPISLINAVLPRMMANGWGRIVNLTSSAVKAPIPGLDSSTACRLGLAGFTAGRAKEAIGRGVTINSILPGRIMTDRQQAAVRREALRSGLTVPEQQARMEQAIPAGRFGRSDEVGALCAFLCSEQAGYVTAQNILIDGGAFPGTL
ncbi:MAG: SDR family oxidoreductase [Noviherbaspirillum sp.]